MRCPLRSAPGPFASNAAAVTNSGYTKGGCIETS